MLVFSVVFILLWLLVLLISITALIRFSWIFVLTYRTSAITSPGLILFFHFQSPLLLSKIRVLFKVRVLFNVGYYLRSYGIWRTKDKNHQLFCWWKCENVEVRSDTNLHFSVDWLWSYQYIWNSLIRIRPQFTLWSTPADMF